MKRGPDGGFTPQFAKVGTRRAHAAHSARSRHCPSARRPTKDVARRVKDKNGTVIKTYTERVPVNYSHNRYQPKCESCGHEWSVQEWEPY